MIYIYSALSICTSIRATTSSTLSIFALDCRAAVLIQGWHHPLHRPPVKEAQWRVQCCPALGIVSPQSPGETRRRATSGKANRSQKQAGVIYGQRGVLQIAAARVEWTVGQEGAWEETVCFFCMTHENIMNSSQVQTHIHTFLFVKACLKYVRRELQSTL